MKPLPRKTQSDVLREEIAETRRRLDQTLSALSGRMTGPHLVDEAVGLLRSQKGSDKIMEWKDKASRAAQSTAQSVVENIKANPWPVALIGAGAAWWIYSSVRAPRAGTEGETATYSPVGYESDDERIEPDIAGAGDNATDAASNPTAAASEVAREKMRRTLAAAKRAVARSQAAVTDTVQDHPLEIGLGILALGVVAGLLLPTPEKASEVVGDRADRLREKARDTGRDLLRRGRSVAEAAGRAARSEAEAQGLLKKKSTVPTLENVSSPIASNLSTGSILPAQGDDELPAAEEV